MDPDNLKANLLGFIIVLSMLAMIATLVLFFTACSPKILEPIAKDIIDIDERIIEAETGIIP